MSEESKQSEQSEQTGDLTAEPVESKGFRYGTDDPRPRPDPVLTKRLSALHKALHGTAERDRTQALNWSGVDETTAALDSIAKELEASVPRNRPTSDLPQTSAGTKQGG
jgi:hypothetical protein